MTQPRATVFVPVLNNAAYIGALMHSLAAQWRPDLELVVIDDASSDGSLEAAQAALAGRPDIVATFVRNERTLGYGAVGSVIPHARAEVLIEAHSDDIALPGRIDALLACFDADPTCRLVTSNSVMLSPDGAPLGLFDPDFPDAVVRDPLPGAGELGSRQWLGATEAFHRSLFEDFPPLEAETFPYGVDLLLPLRAALSGSHHYLSRPLVGWRQHNRNSHRLAGALSREDAVFERYSAWELMGLAQRIRDVDSVMASDPEGLAPVRARIVGLFLAHFETWTRARNRLGERGAPPPAEDSSPIPLPAAARLRRGQPRRFGAGEDLGAMAQGWSGVHGPEATWNWTSRSAVLALDLADDGMTSLKLELRNALLPEPQRVEVSVDLAPPTVIDIAPGEASVVLPLEAGRAAGLASVVLHVPSAAAPSHLGLGPDVRTLGVQLLSIEAA